MFLVVKCESIPDSFRGYLSRWLIEVDPNLFVGKVNRKVFEGLCDRIETNTETGRSVIIYSYNNEQGYNIVTFNSHYETQNYDGMTLVAKLTKIDT